MTGATTPQMSPAWTKRWRYDREHGRTRYVDPTPVAAHIETLVALGASRASIGLAAGRSKGLAASILRGRPRVKRTTAERILTLTIEDIRARRAPTGFVPAHGTQRRIRALMALGYGLEGLGDAGIPHCGNHIHQSKRWVTRDVHDRTAEVFARLCMTPGPSKVAASRAKKRGYAPPLAWDDIDDPNERPNLTGRKTP